jgi:hypothetical protein
MRKHSYSRVFDDERTKMRFRIIYYTIHHEPQLIEDLDSLL